MPQKLTIITGILHIIIINAVLQVLEDHQRLTRIPSCLLGTLGMLSLMGAVLLVIIRAGLTLDSRTAQPIQAWLLVKTRPVLPGHHSSSNGWKFCVAWMMGAPPC